jgi:hypothetical protein
VVWLYFISYTIARNSKPAKLYSLTFSFFGFGSNRLLHLLVSGLADIIGRRFGSHKIPYNRNKSLAGSVAMVSAGFLASIGYSFSFSFIF